MSSHKARIEAVRVLVEASAVKNDAMRCSLIAGELNQVRLTQKVSDKRRRWLLQVLHSTRALDTTLATYVVQRPIISPPGDRAPRGLGEYLDLLKKHRTPGLAKLSGTAAKGYKRRIADPRNDYMHKAGAFPSSEKEVRDLLSEMESCLTEVLGL